MQTTTTTTTNTPSIDNPLDTRNAMATDGNQMRTPRNTTALRLALATLTLAAAACGPEFDPSSLVETTRVVGARVEVEGAPNRATPAAGESATVTWLVTAPEATPPLGWAFALCAPGAPGKLSCSEAPIQLFTGNATPPRVTFTVPSATDLEGAKSLLLYGRICDDSQPTFDPDNGMPACAGRAGGTTATVTIRVQTGDDANQNPTADHGFTFDGQSWGAPAAGADACADGPLVSAGSKDHVIALTTMGIDRESYTVVQGDPPAPTALRESLQISHFTNAGKLKNPFSFVDGTNPDAAPIAEVKWTAPKTTEITAPTPVTFTFVVRDNRGGTDWTTRALCVTP